MCTPWTRRDWSTCFLAFPKGSVVFRHQSVNDSTKKKKRSPKVEEYKGEKERVPTQKSLEIDKKHETSWFPVEDEDYIVFCIGKDGAIRVGKDRSVKALSPASLDDRARCGERSARRRVNFDTVLDGKYAEEEEEVKDIASECAKNRDHMDASTKEASSIIHDDKEKGKCTSTSTKTDESSTESCTNNISSDDSSRSSFAFPVLNKDDVSSPARMPEVDFLHFRNHKLGITCPHCRRFN